MGGFLLPRENLLSHVILLHCELLRLHQQEQESGIEITRGVDSLPSYIERCDGLLTPLVEEKDTGKWWGDNGVGGVVNLIPGNFEFFRDYHSPSWKEYASRFVCRIRKVV